MNILPSFLLSLELFSLLKPTQPLRYGTELKLVPIPDISITAALIMEEQSLVAGSALFTAGTKESNLTISLGPVSTGGIITEIESPVPGNLKAAGIFNGTSSTASVSLPTLSADKTASSTASQSTFYSSLKLPHVTAFLAQCDADTIAGGSSLTFGSSTIQAVFSSAGHRTVLPEQHSSSWFSRHPWEQSRELISTLYTGSIRYTSANAELLLDEAAGCSRLNALDTHSAAEPDRWYSRTSAGIRMNPISFSTHFFISDYDFMTPKGNRISDTLKYGISTQLNIPCSWLTGTESSITLGGSYNRTLHVAENGIESERWQKSPSLQIGYTEHDFSASSSVTLTDEISTNTRVTFSGGGCFMTTSSPFTFTTPIELISGTFGFHLTPEKGQKIQAEVTIKKAALTKVSGTLSLTIANIRNELSGSFSPVDETYSWSIASSAKW